MKTSRLSKSQLKKLYHLYRPGNINVTQAARMIGVTRNTIKRYIRLWHNAGILLSPSTIDAKSAVSLFRSKPYTGNEQFKQLLPKLIGSVNAMGR